jgi:hypothetical protein
MLSFPKWAWVRTEICHLRLRVPRVDYHSPCATELWFRAAMKEYWTLRIRADKVKLGARSLARMFGSFLRDGGILVIVFGILDKYGRPNSFPVDWVIKCWWVGVGCFVVGAVFGLMGGDY